MDEKKQILKLKLVQETGFGIIEVLVATLLFSLTAIGLLSYQNSLLGSLKKQYEYRKVLSLAHQYLEISESDILNQFDITSLNWPESWEVTVQSTSISDKCTIYQVHATQSSSQSPQQAQLSRLVCND